MHEADFHTNEAHIHTKETVYPKKTYIDFCEDMIYMKRYTACI